ncbi:hypothetical protein [Methylobacterium nonmethylotrophicum]|uniref:Uncharacterized protein n=1 Tax=Methylobacterium nonmethylotrophicum TaxID=1141884 RepID=A0A4Z0NUK1_9HYPH|nr:hypothetical protein [Methylobacterium nonmethylotrophicum]TGE00827.1 hypothetical protein EU555_08810 [Methylobacterium nonmethylotrophicum]
MTGAGVRRRRAWAGAGVVLACLGLAGVAGALTPAFGGLSRLESALTPESAGPETRITLGPGGRDVRLFGDLTDGAAARLGRLLDAHPGVTRLHLTSDGGLVDEGAAIGEIVAARRLVTYVPDYCVSACTLAFVRGRERLIMADSRIGFHAPYEPGLFGRMVPVDASEERGRYLAAGLEPAFVDQALGTPSRDIWIPDPARLRAARVVTRVVGPGELPDSTLDDDDSPAGARAAALRAVDLLSAFALHRPGVLDGIAARYRDGYRQGRSESEGLDLLRAEAVDAMRAAFAGADDGTVAALGRLLLDAMAASGSEEACRAIGQDGNLLTAAEALAGRRTGGTARMRALLDRALVGPAPEGPAARVPEPTRAVGCAELRRRLAGLLSRGDAPRLREALFGQTRRLEASALPGEP